MDLFSHNLSLVLAHSVVYETKQFLSPNGIVDDARNGGDPPAPTATESTAEMLKAYTQGLPGLLKTTTGQLIPTGQAIQNAQNVLAPQQYQLMADMFQKYGPSLNAVGNDINRQNALSQAGTNLAILQGPGKDILNTTQELQKQLDPEYYKTRQVTGDALSKLIGSINIDGLSGSERAEVERGLNQQNAARGTLGTPSQISTVENAMQFGSALQGKRNALGQAIGQATNFMGAAQGPVNAFQTTTGQPSGGGNQGAAQFAGVNTNPGQEVFNFGNNLMGNISGTQNNAMNINANRRDSLDRATGFMGSLPSVS